ncbi:hypothetical protein ACH4JS_36770 [Streptomyces sp. NPDC017638]
MIEAAKLVKGGLVPVSRQGRHRYHRLASPDVSAALEALAARYSTAVC